MNILSSKSELEIKKFNSNFKRLMDFSSDPHDILTPLELCNDIISKIHDEQNFKSSTKVLILCNIEFIIVLQMLYNTLNINIDNVHFVTICPTKSKSVSGIITQNNIHKYNSYKEFFEDNDLPKFDVIIGNPPYQGKKIGGGDTSGNAIWHKFVEKVFNISTDEAYISLIHPCDWRGSNRKYKKAKKLLMNSSILFLEPASTIFMDLNLAEVYVDYYLLCKTKTNIKTKIRDINIDITNNDIPNGKNCNTTFLSIIDKVCTGDNGCYFRKGFGGLNIRDENKPKGKYNFAYGVKFLKDEFKTYDYPHIHQDNLKVIIPANKWDIAVIDDGKLGIDDHVHYILCDNIKEAQFIKSVFESKIMKLFLKAFQTNKISYNPIHIKKIKLESLGSLSDLELYNHFNLTEEEIGYIEQ